MLIPRFVPKSPSTPLTAPTRIALLFLGFAALAIASLVTPAGAAELVMFEDAGCMWCARFNAEVAPIYPKTDEGKRAPLRRLESGAALPADLAFITAERLTPLFVLVDNGREVGRIRGYPGEDHFWGLFDAMVERTLGKPPADGPAAREPEKPLRPKS